MKIKQHPYEDYNSPGMLDAYRAERDDEGPLEDIEIDDDSHPALVAYAKEHGYRPAFPRVLPAERFSDARATPEQCAMMNAPTGAENTGAMSTSVQIRLRSSCCGWRIPPSSEEFYQAIQAETPDERQRAIMESWSMEAEDVEVLQGWTEHAYTLRELAAALRRSGIERCAIAETLNRLSE